MGSIMLNDYSLQNQPRMNPMVKGYCLFADFVFTEVVYRVNTTSLFLV